MRENHFCIVAVAPVKDAGGELEIVFEGDLLGVAPLSRLLRSDGVIVECECERGHVELIRENAMGLLN